MPQEWHNLYDYQAPNVVEVSTEMYNIYIVNSATGELASNDTSWIITFITKDDPLCYYLIEH